LYIIQYLDNSELDELGAESNELVGVDIRVLCPLIAESQHGGLVHDHSCTPGMIILMGHHMIVLHISYSIVHPSWRVVVLGEGEVILGAIVLRVMIGFV